MRAGRPRKAGERWPSGGLKRNKTNLLKQMKDHERDLATRGRIVVLMQPHRRGEISQMAESPIGRFVLRFRLRDELFNAAMQWATSKRKWLSAMGAPMPDHPGGTGRDVDMRLVRKWRAEALDGENVMRSAGGCAGFNLVERMAFDVLDTMVVDPAPAVAALLALAVYMGTLPSNATTSR